MSKGPVQTPHGSNIKPMVNRNAGTIRKNCIVGYGTPASTGERAIDGLNVSGVGGIAGAIQHAVDSGDRIDVFQEGDLILESDGSGTIAAGDRLVAVAGASLAVSGRVKSLPGSPTAGTNYEIVGEALTAAAAAAGAEVTVRWRRYTLQG